MIVSTTRALPPFRHLSWGIEPDMHPVAPRSAWHRRFVAYFHFVGWDCWSLGVHIAWCQPNVEVHVPFGFFRVGWMLGPWRRR